MSLVKNIAIVGGSGQSGSPIVESLVATGKFTITAISRDESSSTFPSPVKVVRGDYSDSFFESSLKGQDALIIILATTAPKELQSRLIKAAASASVPWVLPCEFGPDDGNPTMSEGVPMLASKKRYRDEIQALGKSNWIGFVNGLWFDFSLKLGFYGFNFKERTVRLYDDGTTKLSTSTLPQVGRGVAKLFELPAAELEKYKNNFVRINSFHVSQMEMFTSVMKATGTEEKDWIVTKIPIDDAIAQGTEAFQSGDRKGAIDILYGMNFKPGAGGNFQHKSDNKVLGLEEEDLDEVVRRVVKEVEGN